MRRLEGKVLLLAGGGAIGSGIAKRYAREGAQLVLGDIGPSAQAIVDEIVADGGIARAVTLDGTDEESIRAALAVCRDDFGGLDGFHLNFACFETDMADPGIIDIAMDVFDEVMRVNVRGFALCTKLLLPALIERGGGSVLYTSSVSAYRKEFRHIGYAMTKAAILPLMRHVATRYGGDGVRANAIAPGVIARPGQAFPQDVIDRALLQAEIKSRIGTPDDIAAMSALLMSEDGAFITGQTISVDGGISMRP